MRPPIGFMGPGHQTPACFPTADARILLAIPSGQTQCIFRLRGEKFRECRYRNRPRPSDGACGTVRYAVFLFAYLAKLC